MASGQQTTGGVLNLDWYRTLSRNGVHAFWAGAAGWALDAYDLIALTLVLTAIGSTFGVSSAQTGLIVTVTLVVSALGGSLLAVSIGLTGAIVFGCVAYALALVSLFFLPETRGKEFVALD